MSDRRAFLKAASALPLGVAAQTSAPASPSGGQRTASAEVPANASGFFAEPPHVAEQHYDNYRLLGTPEPDANLLGRNRPPQNAN